MQGYATRGRKWRDNKKGATRVRTKDRAESKEWRSLAKRAREKIVKAGAKGIGNVEK